MHTFRKLMAATVLAGSAMTASAFTGVTIFGDSLSDTGNVFAATGGTTPPPPYYAGRFSNGPTWVEYLAAGLGYSSASNAALMGGSNYAFGGARMNAIDPVPGVLQQIGGFWAPSHPLGADPGALYVVVGGGNDMRDARSAYKTNSAADADGRQAAAEAAAANMIAGLGFLASAGARNVLISNLPDLGTTPEAALLGLTMASSDVTSRFNSLMPSVLAAGASLGLQMSFLDMAGLMEDIRDDALNHGGATFGITNVSTPCGTFAGSIGISCDVSLFSDALHPSARAHQLLGMAAIAAVPEPEVMALMPLGMVLVSFAARRARRRV